MPVLLLLFGVSGGLWLDVPVVQQEKDGCGSAVIWMVMEYWKAVEHPPVADIQRELYSAQAGDVYASDMERYFRQHGFQTFVFNAEWDDLEQHLSERRPLIVSLEQSRRGVPLHYAVVAGLDTQREMIWLNDPAGRKRAPMGRFEFEKHWMDHWTLLAIPGQEGHLDIHSELPLDVGASLHNPVRLEAATAAFREQRYADARREVAAVLRTHPADPLANDFMATLFFIDDNLEAALKYWNRAGKPHIGEIRFDPILRSNPVLVERAIAFSHFSTLDLRQYRISQARLDQTSIFPRYRFDLAPTGNGRFDAVLHANESNGVTMLSVVLPHRTTGRLQYRRQRHKYPLTVSVGCRTAQSLDIDSGSHQP